MKGSLVGSVFGCLPTYLLAAVLVLVSIVGPVAGPARAQEPPAASSGDPSRGCPPTPRLADRLRGLPLDRSSRATVWHSPLPPGLLRAAAESPGEVMAARDGKKGHGLVVVELPREALWKAVNDEDRYAEALGLVASRVVAGTPRGTERWIFQAFRRLGVGRWWVDRVRMNGRLARDTGGQLWELVWTDDFDAVPPEQLPADLAALASDLRPVAWTRGAWVFMPLTPSCTLIDYFVWSDPGGLISGFQALGANKAVRDTVEGLVAYTRRADFDAPGAPPVPFLDATGAPLSSP